MRHRVAPYGVALAATALAVPIRWLLEPVLGAELPFFSFYFAVLASAWYGSFGPGMLALALGGAAALFFFIEPRWSLQVADPVFGYHVLRYAGVGVCVALICEALHRQAHRALAQGELVRVTLASIGDAVITTDTEGRVSFLNPVAESVTGWSQHDGAGLPLDTVFQIVNEETRRPVENPATRALREGVIVGLANHTVLIRKDGSERPIDDSAAPIRDEHGRVSGCVLIFRDISDRRRTEKRIQDLVTDLKDADRRKDEFLATLAHELRNPLAPLRNVLEVLKRAEADPDARRRALDTMERQLAQMVRVVDDLIDVSRISREKLELRLDDVELASVVRDAVETCQSLAQEAGHAIRVTLPPDPIYLHADPVRLTQVFSNLISNSCKYTPPGGEVRISARGEGSEVVVSVADTGTGIPRDKLGSIFEMFTQVDRSLERAQGGLGIGLTLVKRLVEMHGGSVEARSEGEGRGSEFVVRLPVTLERRAPAPSAPEPPPEPIAARRILVVDDNRDAATSLVMLLELLGHETRAAHDGEEALNAVETFRPEVVLLDIGMPKLNGYEVCRRIREQPWSQTMVFIALTGWGQDEDRQRSQEAGFDGHLVKPVDHAALLELLRSAPSLRSAGGRPA